MLRFLACFATILSLLACGTEDPNNVVVATSTNFTPAAQATRPAGLSLDCDDATRNSEQWLKCQSESYSLLSVGFEESFTNAALVQATLLQGSRQVSDFLQTIARDPARLNTLLSPSSLATLPATGDPFRHPDSPGPNGRSFYETEAEVATVLFRDRDCTRLEGKIWMPKQAGSAQKLPTVVINNGSVVGTQILYFWAAQALVRAGYQVMTFDHRSQGRSGSTSPEGEVGANLEPSVYWLNLVDAIDFLRSSPGRLHPYHEQCQDGLMSDSFNPFHSQVDLERLGVAGHSFGAAGATFAQSFGAEGADPWPGKLDTNNPIDVIVAWDALGHPDSPIDANGGPLTPGVGNYAGPTYNLSQTAYPKIVARVPALNIPSDFGALATPALLGTDPDRFLEAFEFWKASEIDTMVVVPHASTHTQFSQNPFLPASSWCASSDVQACQSGWVIAMTTHYSVAWFDRFLKLPREPGYDSADERLLDNGNRLSGAANMSWLYRSARYLRDRSGFLHECIDLRRNC